MIAQQQCRRCAMERPMTDITELAQSLKAAAKKATPGPWALARDRKTVVSNQSHPIANLSDAMHRMLADGTTGQDAEFISLANPANVIALIEALEKAQQRIAELESSTVTVKLPDPPGPMSVGARTVYLGIVADVVGAFQDGLNAAGIKVEVE